MMDRRVILTAGGAAIGAAQTLILREVVDKQYGQVLPQLGNWGYPSVLAGIVGGGIATAVGISGKLPSDTSLALLAYGVPAIVGGVLSALYPVATAPAARAAPKLKLAGATTLKPTATKATATAVTAPSEIRA